MDWISVFLISYLIGSISTAYFLGRLLFKVDISKEGSGNLGAKNSWEVKGFSFGLLVFVIDVCKGLGTMLLIKALYGEMLFLYLAAFGVILGHNFSIYIGFRGGKGLASVLGILSILSPFTLLVLIILAAVFRILAKDDGVAAMIAAFPFTVILWLVNGDWRSIPFAIGMTVVVLVKHRSEEYEALKLFLQLKR